MKCLPKETQTKNIQKQQSHTFPFSVFLWNLNWDPWTSTKCSPKHLGGQEAPRDMDSMLQVSRLPGRRDEKVFKIDRGAGCTTL